MCKKAGTAFPGEPGGVPSKDHNTRREQGSPCPLWVNKGWAPLAFSSSSAAKPRCRAPGAMSRRAGEGGEASREVSPCLFYQPSPPNLLFD